MVSLIEVTPQIRIGEDELQFSFVRASGPGGQHVNKVATAVQLRFDVLRSPSLPEEVRQRLMRQAGKRITESGVLILDARRFRSQRRNRQDAVDRLRKMIADAAVEPKRRRRTKPSRESRRKRLEEKRRLSEKKRLRKNPDHGNL